MSIRRYLVLILLSVITLVTFVAAIEGYRVSMTRASELFDGELTSLAQTLMVITPSFNPSQQQITEVGADVSIEIGRAHV